MRYYLLNIAFFCCGLSILPQRAQAQGFGFAGRKQKQTISFQLIKNLIVIPVYLNQQGPFNFILDTGIGAAIVTDTALVSRLNPPHLRKFSLTGFGHNINIEAWASNFVAARIGNATTQALPTIFLANDPFNLSGYLGMKISGLIGHPFFNYFVVKINYVTKSLKFGAPGTFKSKGHKLALTFIDKKPYLNLSISTEKAQENIMLIVDCGASHALSLERFQGVPWPIPQKNIQASLGVGLGGEIFGHISRIGQLHLGPYTLYNVLANFPQLDQALYQSFPAQRNGNLGADILKRFTTTFDYPNRAIYLKKSGYFSTPFEHDMSGLEVFQQNGGFVIARVDAQSPGEEAGLQAGDQLTGINFKSATHYSLNDIAELFKTKGGGIIVLEIYRKKQFMVKLLKLKRRI